MTTDEKNDDIARLVRMAGARTSVPDAVTQRVRENVRAAWQAETAARSRRRMSVWGGLAAAAAIAAAVWLGPMRSPDAPPAIPSPASVASVERIVGDVRVGAAPARIGALVRRSSDVTTGSGRTALRLNDGTSLRMDEDSVVVLRTARRIELKRGAIYVDSAKSGLVIDTPFGTARDVGTKFEVRVTSRSTRVRVRDGAVDLRSRRAVRGEQLEVTASGSFTTQHIDPWSDEWSWSNAVAPRFAVEGKRVDEFLHWVSSESGLTVHYATTSDQQRAATAILHGSIGDLRPLQAADAVLPTAGLKASTRDGVLTVMQP